MKKMTIEQIFEEMDEMFEEYNYVLPASWASAIINSDTSGMSDEEEEELDQFYLEELSQFKNYTITLKDMEQEPYFARKSDAGFLGGDMLDFVVIVIKEEAVRDHPTLF